MVKYAKILFDYVYAVTFSDTILSYATFIFKTLNCYVKRTFNYLIIFSTGTGSRLNPPLPEVYFGNAIHVKRVKTTAGELLENGLGWAAMELNKVVNSQNSEEVVKIYKEWAENPVLFSKSTVFVGSKLAISSSPRHNIYNTDFGWGKPVAVRSGMANKSDGKITLFPGVEEGSVDIEICCLPKTLQAMENDSEFMEAVTN